MAKKLGSNACLCCDVENLEILAYLNSKQRSTL